MEGAEREAWLSHKNVILGLFDSLTFGVPLGLYGLVVDTGQGFQHLTQGQYERAGRELTGATLVVLGYAEARALAETPTAAPVAEESSALKSLARAPGLPHPDAAQLWEAQLWDRAQRAEPPTTPLGRLGDGDLRQLAGYLRDNPDAALFVYDNGETGALALARAKGNVAAAQALLPELQQPLAMASGDTGRGAPSSQPQASASQSRPPRTPSSAPASPAEDGRPDARTARAPPPAAPEQAPTLDEVLDQKISEFDPHEPGERMTGDMEALARKRPILEEPPPGVAANAWVWQKYVRYWQTRLAEMLQEQQAHVPPEDTAPPPRTWESFKRFFENILKGREFEERIAAMLREKALRPAGQRGELADLTDPILLRHPGVSKGKGTKPRYPDVVAYDGNPAPGQRARWVTFSIKCRGFKEMPEQLRRQAIEADAKYAHDYYGGELEMRRRSMDMFGKKVRVDKVYLIYAIEQLTKDEVESLQPVIDSVRKRFGVEVLFR